MAGNRVEKIQKLVITEDEETSRTLEDKNAQLDKQLKGLSPVVCCECGAEILLVPDLKAMDLAIKAHVAKHKGMGEKLKATKELLENLVNCLVNLRSKK